MIFYRMKSFINSQSPIVALLVDTDVDGLVDSYATTFNAVVHIFVALVQHFLATADARLYLT